jgi:signal transduction histidine kinase
LRVQIGLAGEKLEDRPAEQLMLNRLGRELDYAIEDVRNVARRFMTPFVVRNGLGAALRSIARTWPLNVRVDDRGLSRHDPATELTVYSVCLEALQNTLDHGGQGASAQVRIKDAADGIWFSIADDGVGFDVNAVRPANGLLSMGDRALLAGGTIHVDAAPSRGVTISGRIPDPR